LRTQEFDVPSQEFKVCYVCEPLLLACVGIPKLST
jgi:hypothetical protein